ncbi:MAG: Acyl-CoA dehydrogenase, Mycobacterial subgroup FadE23, partial [uncultured Nocardioides sp.]
DQPGDPQEAGPAHRPGPPAGDEHAAPHLAQVRPRRARVPPRARHARRPDRRRERDRRHRRSGGERRTTRHRGPRLGRHGPQRRQHGLRPLDRGDVLGRHGAAAVDAATGTGQLRHRLGGRRGAARAVRRHLGRDGHHRAGRGLRLRQHHHHRGQGRRRVRHQRREDLRHLRGPRRQRRRLGHPRQGAGARGDQVVPRAQGQPGDEGRAARAQARDPRLGHRGDHLHRLPGAGRGPPGITGGRHQVRLRRGDGDLRQHASAGRGDGGRLRACRARPDARPAGAGRRHDRPRPSGAGAVGSRGEAPPAGGRLGGRPPADDAGRVDGRQPQAQLAGGLDGQGEGGPGRLGRHPELRPAVRDPRLQRGRAAGEVGSRLEDPRHLRGHPADPAADRRPAPARAHERAAAL